LFVDAGGELTGVAAALILPLATIGNLISSLTFAQSLPSYLQNLYHALVWNTYI